MSQKESKKPRKESRHELKMRIEKSNRSDSLGIEHVVNRWTLKYGSLKEAQDKEMVLPIGHVGNNAFDYALLSGLIKSMTISYDKQLSWLKELIAAYTCTDDYKNKYSSRLARLKVHCNKALKDACKMGNLQMVNLLLQSGGEFIVPPTMDVATDVATGATNTIREKYNYCVCLAKQISRNGHEEDNYRKNQMDQIAEFIEDIDPHFVAALKGMDEVVMELLLSQGHWRHWELYLYAIAIGILTFEYTAIIKIVFHKAIHSLQMQMQMQMQMRGNTDYSCTYNGETSTASLLAAIFVATYNANDEGPNTFKLVITLVLLSLGLPITPTEPNLKLKLEKLGQSVDYKDNFRIYSTLPYNNYNRNLYLHFWRQCRLPQTQDFDFVEINYLFNIFAKTPGYPENLISGDLFEMFEVDNDYNNDRLFAIYSGGVDLTIFPNFATDYKPRLNKIAANRQQALQHVIRRDRNHFPAALADLTASYFYFVDHKIVEI